MKLPLCSERVYDVIHDDGHRPRPFVEPEIVAIRGGIRIPPLARPGARVEGLDHFAVGYSMKQDQSALNDNRAAEPGADGLAPNLTRAARTPGLRERRAPGDAVPLWAEELRPVLSSRLDRHSERDDDR